MTVLYFPQTDGQVVAQNVYKGLRGVFLLFAHQAQQLYRTGNLQPSVTAAVLSTIKERAVHLPHAPKNKITMVDMLTHGFPTRGPPVCIMRLAVTSVNSLYTIKIR